MADLPTSLGIPYERVVEITTILLKAFERSIEDNDDFASVFRYVLEEMKDPLELLFTGYMIRFNEPLLFSLAGNAVLQKRSKLDGYG